MALWQYRFQVLTKNSFENIDNVLAEQDEFDDGPYWQYETIDRSLFSELNTILKKRISWSNQIDLYGDQESNCFEVLFDQDSIVLSASFRIDFTSDYEKILSQIIEFCILSGLAILDEQLRAIPLNVETVSSLIEQSSQVKRYNELKDQS